MKLIQIFALATVMATAAVAQTTGQGNATGSQQSSPSPTPKPTAKPAPAGAKSGAVKTSPAAAAGHAKTSPSRSAHASTKSVAKDKKPAVQTGVLPDKKKKGPAHEPAKAGTKAATPATPAKATAAIKPGAPAKGSAATKETAKKNMAPAAAAKPKAPANAAKAAGPKPKDKMKSAAPAPAAKVTASAPPAPPEKKPLPRLIGAAGRRDPFVSPIRNAGAINPSQSCTSGKRCLNIPELVLQGTVRDISGKMMAVVSTANHTRTYTLRENDQVFNGSVEKITSDSIIFREYVKDLLGRETAKEVVKKLGPTS